MEREKSSKLNNLPPPRPGRAGALRTIILAFIAVAILACAGFWLTRTPDEKEKMRMQAGDSLASLLEGTPFVTIADFLRPPPPPLPPAVVSPPTEKGTLAGQEIAATIASPMDFGPGFLQPRPEDPAAADPLRPEDPGSSSSQQVVFDQEPVAPVTEDSRLKADYVNSLARWLVNRYRPGPQGGTLSVSVQALNHECGVTLAGRTQGGRSGLLRYAFHPAMISGLYNLYIGRFMEDLESACRERGFDAARTRQFYRAVAGRAAILASGLAGVQRVPDLPGKLANIDNLARKAVDANADLTTAVFELDQLRSGSAGSQALATAQMRVNGATARYRRASDDHAQAQAALAADIRRYSGQNMDEDTLLFMAAWVARRYAQGGQARGAVESCIAALRDLTARCTRYGEEL